MPDCARGSTELRQDSDIQARGRNGTRTLALHLECMLAQKLGKVPVGLAERLPLVKEHGQHDIPGFTDTFCESAIRIELVFGLFKHRSKFAQLLLAGRTEQAVQPIQLIDVWQGRVDLRLREKDGIANDLRLRGR